MKKFKEDPDAAEKTPDLDRLRQFVREEVLYDPLVRQSIEDGYMTEPELLIGRWIYRFLDLNAPEGMEEGQDIEKQNEIWLQKLPEASQKASEQFDIKPEKAEELFQKALNIRNRTA